ncbi:FAD-binding oxidoreductase [Dactylosporangium sp. CS-047395]|uniref:FAD-binding oxidoreductase n=1 Tax=Dactylosporangium sp. CS-047395 TaxID=3239936 RepID=UPI003D91DC8A
MQSSDQEWNTMTDPKNPAVELGALAEQVRGPVLTPDDAGYADETTTWNLAVPQRPSVVVGAAGDLDVQAAVRFAARHDLPVAVVATGHGAVHHADGGLLINTRRMRGITIDAARRAARVEAGVEWQEVLDAAAAHGLAPLAGSSPNVGVVGYTLGGGLSPALGRTYGFAADHVTAIELVTADGVLRRADADHEPELFWALRGGKGNFGVVTALEFDLMPVSRLYGGGLYFSAEHVEPVLAEYRRLVADAPDELTLSFAFLRLPPLPFLPEPLQGRFSLHVRVAYLGTAEEGERLIAGLRAIGPRLLDTVAEMPFTAIAGIHADPVDPLPVHERGVQLRDLPAEAVAVLVALAGPQADLPVLMVEVRQLGGALGVDPKVPNAVGHREARFNLFAATPGGPPEAELFHTAIGRVTAALAPWATGGALLNFLTASDDTPQLVATAFEPATYERLRIVKRAYDPANMFRLNHNIAPSEA